MRYLLLLFSCIIPYLASNAQTHYEKKFIQFAIGKGNIWYGEKIESDGIDFVRETLSKDTLFDWRYMTLYAKRGLPDSLVFVLTKSEHAFINKELDGMKGFAWKKHLFKNSLLVNFEKWGAYRKAHQGKSSFNSDDYKNGGYRFTKPIFIRNKSVCFLYITHHDDGKVLMYVRNRTNWRIKYVLDFWVS
ncbi:MAG: hypothetical protein V4553_20485 [Bacteroidota bacterium]